MKHALQVLTTLRERVDSFSDAVAARHSSYVCRSGCASCCAVALTVCQLEADSILVALEQRHLDLRDRLARTDVQLGERCVFLNDDQACDVYEARPLICRSQGLPLAFAQGQLAEEQVFGELEGEEAVLDLTWCPLNFEDDAPSLTSILVTNRIDEPLARANAVHAEERRLERIDLRDLVARAAADI